MSSFPSLLLLSTTPTSSPFKTDKEGLGRVKGQREEGGDAGELRKEWKDGGRRVCDLEEHSPDTGPGRKPSGRAAPGGQIPLSAR